MYSVSRDTLRFCAGLLCAALTGHAGELASSQGASPAPRVLRVAADPNNLPFSNARLEGFENRIIGLLAEELHAEVEYTWVPQRRGFFRVTLKEAQCDVVPGVPRGLERTLTTQPYYRSSYVFLSRAERNLDVRCYDDPRLRQLKVGVQLIGDDSANTPPVHELSDRGIVENVRGFTVYGSHAGEAPLGEIVEAVKRGEIDIAIVWGPLAGYYAKKSPRVFAVVPVAESGATAPQPTSFDICVGVRRGESALRDELNEALARRRADIQAILDEFGVPRASTDVETGG
jgi:mxaJ protein